MYVSLGHWYYSDAGLVPGGYWLFGFPQRLQFNFNSRINTLKSGIFYPTAYISASYLCLHR